MDELRRDYHDRIATLRSQTTTMVTASADGVGNVTAAILAADRRFSEEQAAGAQAAAQIAADVERDVLDLLAQQAPLARDLRVILASLAVAHAAELCLGLVVTLAERTGPFPDALAALVGEIGTDTADILRLAGTAWVGIDEGMAGAVITGADRGREGQRRFLGELFVQTGLSVREAVDAGMVARAYGRLTDHAVEIAQQVVFAATGTLRQVGV